MSLIAKALIDESAVFLRPDEPFTWASGIKSPIYCDNRLLISNPEVRKLIVRSFVDLYKKLGLSAQIVAGTATAGIPWAAWIAHELNLPMVYVRSGSKDHGRKNLIEGKIQPQAQTLLIEDLISTGKSSLQAVDILNESQMKVLAVFGLFHYNFPMAFKAFEQKQVKAHALCNLDELLDWASHNHKITTQQAEDIRLWRQNIQIP
jgi:orotate phosphoribosyltransferase